ncbi:hypothetical protein FN846DRAFT_923048 [Sphaerosporella brunnea]|uniref:Uncharacterized protein n=1 Tax=Sphaerosporella brunnea TaxID=1250544 RepID=A0A5J5EGX7_9PEZI|nr:hypothetical protein FN846DRAFT_923048 [Sphaerosporella brunnea]
MALLGDVTANAASTNHKDPPQHYPVPERNATFDPRLRSFSFIMMDHASDIVEDGEELEELPHPNISVRNEPPNALPLPDALPHETREFVLHALCEERHDLVQTDPALVERIYRSWSGDGAYLRSASHAQLKSACHGSSFAAASLAFEIQRLLREEMERAEMERASAAAEQPPRPAEALEAGPEGPRKTGKMPSALARFGMAFMAATGFVGCGLHPPDLVLSEVSPSWRSVVNAVYHLSTVGSAISVVVMLFKWSAVHRRAVRGGTAIWNWLGSFRRASGP